MKRIYLICFACVILLSACSWWSKHEPEKTADELAAEGQEAFEKEHYSDAIKAYEKLGDWYPFSTHAKTASLQIAEAHYLSEEYEEAILAYSEYERMHPNDEKVPYVIYQIGRCHFDRIETIDRDATATENALSTFRRLVEQYPDSEYAKQARPHIAECVSNLAAKEMYVARFYFKSKKYKAALNRFEGVAAHYPDSEFSQEASDYIAQCRAKIAEKPAPEAKPPQGDEKKE
ncbi:MAG: outer membrane protein assembly factor BamD [Desulfosalsimonadaceae bacterium]|nr:outer membrane protein assembly factor BamD [Desulfosalsimonadaceae bacterium]